MSNIEAVQAAIETRFIQSYPDITFVTYATQNPNYVKKIFTSATRTKPMEL